MSATYLARLLSAPTLLLLCSLSSVAASSDLAGLEAVARNSKAARDAVASDRSMAAHASWAKSVANQKAQSGTAENLAVFTALLKSNNKRDNQQIFRGLSTGEQSLFRTFPSFAPEVFTGPLSDRRYLNVLDEALRERIWLPSHPVPPEQYLQTVALVAFNDAPGHLPKISGICTGTLIAPRAVLSAAHCVCELGDVVKVVIGTSDLNSGGGWYVNVIGTRSRLKNCRAFTAADDSGKEDIIRTQGDVAIYYLAEDLTKYGVQPATLGQPFVSGKPYYVIGYGLTDKNVIGTKNGGTIEAVTCTESDLARYGCNPGTEFWGGGSPTANRPDVTDTCSGDSGGPVFIPNVPEPPAIVGTTSRAVKDSYCGRGGIYVLLEGDLLKWVRNAAHNPPELAPLQHLGQMMDIQSHIRRMISEASNNK